MTGTRATLLVTAALTVALALPASAFGLAHETWVAYFGSNSNACTIEAPCATFADAIEKTESGGEVDVLYSGSYGELTITKPITIFASGATAAIDFTGSEGVYVDLPSPGGTVVLHGLDIDGENGVGADAVYDTLGTVDIEECDLYGFSQIGVGVSDENTSKAENTVTVAHSTIDGGTLGVRTFQSPGLSSSYPDQVVLHDDIIENASLAGIFTRDSDGQLVADNDLIEGNDVGFEADTGPASYTLEHDEIDYNTGAGVLIYGPDSGVSQLTLNGDQINENASGGVEFAGGSFPLDALLDGDDINYNTGDGLDAAGGTASMPVSVSNSSLSGNTAVGVFSEGALADVSLANDTITQNATGLEVASGGSIVSYGAANSIFGNTINGSPSSAVSDGAVGPSGPQGVAGETGPQGVVGETGSQGVAGPAGANGSQGVAGTSGAQGPTGSVGPAGANGAQGPAGEIELVTCTNVKKKIKHKTVTQKKCTSKLVSSPVSFTAGAASASISRGGHVDATGSLQDHKLTLHASKALPAGRYTLTLRTASAGHTHASSQAIVLT